MAFRASEPCASFSTTSGFGAALSFGTEPIDLAFAAPKMARLAETRSVKPEAAAVISPTAVFVFTTVPPAS